MLGLRVRGRGGWDQPAPVAASKSAFLWGSTPFLCARAKKWGGTGSRGRGFCPGKRRTRNRARQGGLVIALSACAPILWAVVVALPCLSTPFLWCLPKETVSSRQRKALFYLGGSTIRVSAAASVDGTHLRPTWGGGWWLSGRSSQLDAVGCDVGASSPWERRAGPNCSRGGTQKRVSLGLHPVSLRKSKEMGWNGQQGGGTTSQGNGAHA